MYKLKLIGPNEGKTICIRDYKFVDGYCLVHSVPQNLIKYYGCVIDTGDENELQEKEEDAEVKELVAVIEEGLKEEDGQDILNQVVAAKKAEIEKKSEPNKYKTQGDFTNFFQYKAYVKEVSGKNPKNKIEAEKIMAELS